jgi:hypothetical protein
MFSSIVAAPLLTPDTFMCSTKIAGCACKCSLPQTGMLRWAQCPTTSRATQVRGWQQACMPRGPDGSRRRISCIHDRCIVMAACLLQRACELAWVQQLDCNHHRPKHHMCIALRCCLCILASTPVTTSYCDAADPSQDPVALLASVPLAVPTDPRARLAVGLIHRWGYGVIANSVVKRLAASQCTVSAPCHHPRPLTMRPDR